jgi:hypothetical protein
MSVINYKLGKQLSQISEEHERESGLLQEERVKIIDGIVKKMRESAKTELRRNIRSSQND